MTSGYKLKGKRRKLVPLDALGPHRCAILAVDAALNSGFANYTINGGCPERYCGEAATDETIDVVVKLAAMSAAGWEIPLVLVIEQPFQRNPNTYATLQAIRKKWIAAFEKYAIGHKSKIVHVYPQTWRSKVLFATTGPELPAKEWQVAKEILGREPIGKDEAAAVCIGKWATTAGEVARVLPKRAWGPAQ